ncbi:hypothetical protein ABZ839_32405 [Streptomyces cellulosae]
MDVEAAFATAAGQATQLPWDRAASVRFEDLAPVSAFPVAFGSQLVLDAGLA